MPRRPDSTDAADILTDAVMALLDESGATAVSVRSLGTWMGYSAGGLTTRWGTRGRMLHVAIQRFRARWLFMMRGRSWSEGIMALLPYSERDTDLFPEDQEVEDCRVWLSFCELARRDKTLAECVDAHREDERALVLSRVGERLDEAAIDHVLALVDGLRTALCAPTPMSIERARAVLDAHLGAQGVRAVDLGLTGPPPEFYASLG